MRKKLYCRVQIVVQVTLSNTGNGPREAHKAGVISAAAFPGGHDS